MALPHPRTIYDRREVQAKSTSAHQRRRVGRRETTILSDQVSLSSRWLDAMRKTCVICQTFIPVNTLDTLTTSSENCPLRSEIDASADAK